MDEDQEMRGHEPKLKAADEGFWASVCTELVARQGLLLEETHIVNATRWHRLTKENSTQCAPVAARVPC